MNDSKITDAPDQDAIERLRERAEREFPESWIPEKAGEQIAGELVRYDRGTTAYGEQVIAAGIDEIPRRVFNGHLYFSSELSQVLPKLAVTLHVGPPVLAEMISTV